MKKSVTIQRIKNAFRDERGTIADLLNEKISHVGLIVTEKGAVRGSHYHVKSYQYSYIESGSFEVMTALVKSPKKVTRRTLKAGELISLAPGTLHRFRALSKAVMIDMISESRSKNGYESDVVRVPFVGGVFVPQE